MPTTVRWASQKDIDSLLALNVEVQRLHADLSAEDFKREADCETARAMFEARLGSPETGIAVAEVDGAKIGYVYFEAQTLAETPFNPARRRIYVHHLCVTEAMRRRGVAAELLRFVERQAAENGVSEVALDAWKANAGALSFFESMGFAPFNVALRKRLPALERS